MPALALMLMLGVNDAIEINVFLPSVNASVNVRVNADGRCEYTLTQKRSKYNSRKNESENSPHYYLRHAFAKNLRRNEMCENTKQMLNFH